MSEDKKACILCGLGDQKVPPPAEPFQTGTLMGFAAGVTFARGELPGVLCKQHDFAVTISVAAVKKGIEMRLAEEKAKG
jgi:hypothetical protein